jgi:hypothetical protein
MGRTSPDEILGSPQTEPISFGGSCQCPHACEASAKPSFLIYNRPFPRRNLRLKRVDSVYFGVGVPWPKQQAGSLSYIASFFAAA